ncbi:hemerythrin [Variovorax sp. WS11]|uniref:hemerythrin domain-containing protein n=1 Tax=Variovorax sp. WS11 TaxID=1105204 RepID=UPI000D0E315F|nr:hemerythrin domain-containing protein [Variovorax sp. WS11]NDZ18150.1 hemerythrin domain-containing protein [Variovorax sp. WS11]PSL79757.1 hemerythrin [Variovorax sp. WS11]
MQPPAAIQLIREDHESLAMVLRALREAVEQARHCGRPPDFDALRAMVFYLDEMPARVHHASESELLFPRIRERCPALRPVLDRLDAEHERGESAVRELEHALTAWELMGEARREAFELLVQTHVDVYLGHMEVEESYVLPVAVDYLSPADWRELAEALTHQRRPHSASMAQSHRALFARITAHQSHPKKAP